MSLSKSKLESEFRKVMDSTDPDFVGWPNTILAGVNNFVTAYENYAKDAVDYSADSLLSYNKANFIAALSGLTENSTYIDAANAMEVGFKAFWIRATFNKLKLIVAPTPPDVPECPNVGVGTWGAETTSVVVAVDAANSLYSTLLPELQKVNSEDMTDKVARLANIWHNVTVTTCLLYTSDAADE